MSPSVWQKICRNTSCSSYSPEAGEEKLFILQSFTSYRAGQNGDGFNVVYFTRCRHTKLVQNRLCFSKVCNLVSPVFWVQRHKTQQPHSNSISRSKHACSDIVGLAAGRLNLSLLVSIFNPTSRIRCFSDRSLRTQKHDAVREQKVAEQLRQEDFAGLFGRMGGGLSHPRDKHMHIHKSKRYCWLTQLLAVRNSVVFGIRIRFFFPGKAEPSVWTLSYLTHLSRFVSIYLFTFMTQCELF